MLEVKREHSIAAVIVLSSCRQDRHETQSIWRKAQMPIAALRCRGSRFYVHTNQHVHYLHRHSETHKSITRTTTTTLIKRLVSKLNAHKTSRFISLQQPDAYAGMAISASQLPWSCRSLEHEKYKSFNLHTVLRAAKPRKGAPTGPPQSPHLPCGCF